mgnify:CR=1 FL=1
MYRMEATKKIVFLFLLLSSLSYSQNYYFEVVFKNKGNASLSNPQQFLSVSSIEKKLKRGVAVDESDVPVDASYLTALEQLGVDAVKQSKWRNSALVVTSDTSLIEPLRMLPFVKSALYFCKTAGTQKTQNKFNSEEMQWYAHSYGEAINQLSMLNGHFLHERGFSGEGVDIAIFDAGFPKVFPAITLLEMNEQIKSTFDFVDHDISVFEKDNHGAMVLSVMASNDAYMYGAAPKSNYHLFITEDAATESLLEEYNWLMAAEMAVIRLTHVADLPSPEELVKKLQDATPPPTGGPSGGRPAPTGGTTNAMGTTQAPTHAGPSGVSGSGAQAAVALATDALAHYARYEDVVELIRAHRDVKLLVDVETGVRLVNYKPGRIEVNLTESAPTDLVGRLGSRLQAWTGNRWAITVVNEGGEPTIAEVRDANENELRTAAEAHPLVQAVMLAFPKAKITEIRTEADKAQHAMEDALPEVDEEWDPFEDS